MTMNPTRWPTHESSTVVSGAGKWLDAVSSGFLPLEVRPEQARDFWGCIDSRILGNARAALISSQAHEVRRTVPLVERSECNHLKALWLASGRCEVEQGTNRSVLEGGQWAVYETGRPYSIRFSDQAHFAVALLPIEICADWCVVGRALCARALQVDPASRGAFYTLLSSFESAFSAGAEGFDALGRAMSMMVSESLQAQASVFLPVDRQDRRLRDAQRLVQARLGDPELGPQDLAEALHVSLRSVYSLFRQLDTTPASYIQAERLERCRADLADLAPRQRQRTITEIALANGFADSAHFSRLFKARFGVTAGEWRQRAG